MSFHIFIIIILEKQKFFKFIYYHNYIYIYQKKMCKMIQKQS